MPLGAPADHNTLFSSTFVEAMGIPAEHDVLFSSAFVEAMGTPADHILEALNGLLRSDQIDFRTLTIDRLIDVPIDVLGKVGNFDLTQTREWVVYQNDSAQLGFVLGIFVQTTAVENLTVVPQIGVGIASATNDVLASESLTGVSAVGDVWSNWVVLSKSKNAVPTDTVKINVTAATADKLLANIYLIGFEA